MVEKFDPQCSESTHEYAATVLIEVAVTAFQLMNAGQEESLVFGQLSHLANITKLAELVLSKPNSSAVIYGAPVLVELVQGFKARGVDDRKSSELPPVYQVLEASLGKLKEHLETPNDHQVSTTTGPLAPPFGLARVQVLELLKALAESQFTSLLDSLLKEKLFVTGFVRCSSRTSLLPLSDPSLTGSLLLVPLE